MVKFPRAPLLGAVLGGALFIAGVVALVGPVASDSPHQMASALQDGRGLALVALFGAGLAAVLAFWFLAALRTWMRETIPDGGEELGSVAMAAATLSIGLSLVGMSLFYGATYELAGQGGSPALVGLVDAGNGVMMMTKFSGAALIAAISVAASRSDSLPSWLASLGWLSVLALIGSSIGLFTEDSFTQFGGPLDFYGTLPAALWGLLLMALLYRERPLAPAS